MVATLKELRLFLESNAAHPKKSLSQNFLIDRNILEKIVKAADVSPGDTVLEIGSGPGALTEALLQHGAKVIAVEKDTLYAEKLARFEGVEIYNADITTFPLDTLKRGEGKLKVVANLPYHLTAPILGLLAPRYDLFSSVTVMVQDEVAKRMTAIVGSPDYSALSLFLQFYSHPQYDFKVSNRCFYPVPKVQSAVVTLTLKTTTTPADTFFPLLRAAFQQRRKMLRASLSSQYPKPVIEMTLQSVGVSPLSRPENLSLKEWLAFTTSLQASCRPVGVLANL